MIKFCNFSIIKPEIAELFLKEINARLAPDGLYLNTIFDEEFNGLNIVRKDNLVTIRYSRRVYLFRAIGLVCERANERSWQLQEHARFHSNGLMADCSRNAVLSVDTVKKFIRQMALMGLDTLMLYTEDTYEVLGEPYFGYMRGRYTQKELSELDTLCSRIWRGAGSLYSDAGTSERSSAVVVLSKYYRYR